MNKPVCHARASERLSLNEDTREGNDSNPFVIVPSSIPAVAENGSTPVTPTPDNGKRQPKKQGGHARASTWLPSHEETREEDDSAAFVIVDENGNTSVTPKPEIGKQPSSEETPKREATNEENFAKGTVHDEARTVDEQRDPELSLRALQQSSRTERRWKIERSNELSEEKLMTLDRLQGRLSTILGANGTVDRNESPREIKVFRSLEEASSELSKGQKTEPKLQTIPFDGKLDPGHDARREPRSEYAHGRVNLPAANTVEPSRKGGQEQLFRTFARPGPDEGKGRAYEELEESVHIEDSGQEQRECKDESYNLICELCGDGTSLSFPFAVYLGGHYYHKTCLLRDCFDRGDLLFALRDRFNHLKRNAKPKKKQSAWRRISQRLSNFFRRK